MNFGTMLQIILHNLAVVGRHVMTLSVQYCDLQYCSECVEKGWSPLTHCNDDPGVFGLWPGTLSQLRDFENYLNNLIPGISSSLRLAKMS